MDKEALPLVDIVLLTWNDSESAIRCLRSVWATDYPRFQVVVVDNASVDDTVPAIRDAFSQCKVIVNSSNVGFAAGCNVGIEEAMKSQASYVLILNQDTIVAPGMLAELVEVAQEHPSVGILGPKTYFLKPAADGRPRILYAGAWRRPFLAALQRIPRIGKPEDSRPGTCLPVDYVWGHGMFVRSQVFREIGFLSPAFFMYYEDLDFCRRAAGAGYEIWYVPQAHMWHDISDGERVHSSDSRRWHYKVESIRVFYQRRNGSVVGRMLSWLTLLYMFVRFLVNGQFRAAREIWLACARSKGKRHDGSHSLRSVRPR